MRKKVFDADGRRVKVNSQGVPARNFHALKCLIAFTIVIFALIGLIAGAVFILSDMAVKDLTNGKYGYNDVKNAFNNINDYRKVERNELNNTYKDSDAVALSNTFTNGLANSLFLERLDAADIKDIMDALAEEYAEKMQSGGTESTETIEINAVLSDGEATESSASEKIRALLEKIFAEENIQADKIKQYNDDTSEYSINISDKSMAAFLNETVINSFLDNKALKDAIADNVTNSVADMLSGLTGPLKPSKVVDLNDFDYKNILQLRQITFYSNGTGDNARAGIKLITETNIDNILNTLFGEINGENFLRKDASKMAKFGFDSVVFFAKNLIKGLTPAKLYVSVDIPADGDEKTLVSLNGTTRQDYENIMGILAEMSQGDDGEPFEDPLDGVFGEDSGINNAVKSMNEVNPIKDTITMSGNSGTIKFDAIDFALKLSGVNAAEDGSGTAQKITSRDVYLLLKTIVSADTQAAMSTKADYAKQTPEKQGGGYVLEDGVFKYVPDMDGKDLSEIKNEYQTALFEAFKSSYGLEAENFDKLFEVMSGGNNDEFLKLFRYEKVKNVVNGKADGVTLDALMLSALVAAQTEKFLGNSDFSLASVSSRYVMLRESVSAAPYSSMLYAASAGTTHNIMEVGIEVVLPDLMEKMLPSDGSIIGVIFNKMMAALMPQSMLVRAEIDITAGGEGFNYLPSQFAFDSLEYDKAGRLIRLLDGLAGESGFTVFLEDMLLPVRDMINMMTSSLPGLTISENALVMPDLYSLMASSLNGKLTADEVEQVLKGVYSESEDNVWFNRNGGETADPDMLISERMDTLSATVWPEYSEISFSDAELAAMINSKVKENENFNGDLGSVILLAKSDDSEEADSLRQWLGGFDGQDYNADDYMIITTKLNFDNLGYSGGFDSFMPDDFHVTMVYKMDGITSTLLWYRFNDMSEDVQNCLYDFMGFEEMDDILGAGEGNVGGGYFKTLAETVLSAIDSAVWEKLNDEIFNLNMRVSYSYKASGADGALGELVIRPFLQIII